MEYQDASLSQAERDSFQSSDLSAASLPNTRPSRLTKLGAVLAGSSSLFFGSVPDALAQGGQQESIQAPEGSIANRYHRQDKFPEPIASAFYTFRQDEGLEIDIPVRELQIHRESPENGRHSVYYHRPLFALIETTSPIEGLPGWVVGAAQLNDDVVLTFRVQLTSPEVREICREAVLSHDRKYALQKDTPESEVTVNKWPITHAVFQVRNSATGEVLGYGSTDSLASAGDQAEFRAQFSPIQFQKFASAADQGVIEFVPSFTDAGKFVGEAVLEQSGTLEVSHLMESSFTSEQLAGDSPIFQGQKQEFARQVSGHVRRIIRGNHPEVVDIVRGIAQTQTANQLFGFEMNRSIEELSRQHPQVEAHLAQYLTPLIRRIAQSESSKDVTIEVHEDGSRTDVGGSAGFSGWGFSISGSASKVNHSLERIQNESGVAFVKGEEDEIYRPHSAKVSFLLQGKQSIDLSDHVEAYIELAPDGFYLEDSPIPTTFTAGFVRASLEGPVQEMRTIEQLEGELEKAKERERTLIGDNKSVSESNRKLEIENQDLKNTKEGLNESIRRISKVSGQQADKIEKLEAEIKKLELRLKNIRNGY